MDVDKHLIFQIIHPSEVVEEEMRRLGLKPERIPDDEGGKANLLLTLPDADGGTGGGGIGATGARPSVATAALSAAGVSTVRVASSTPASDHCGG